MTNKEAKKIIIKERDSLRANPMVEVEDCLYEAFDVAIKALEFVEGCEVEDGLYEACKTAIKALEIQRLANGEKIFNVLPLEQEPKWIPVSERLPEEEGNYLVCYNNGYISVSEWHPNPYEKVCFDIFPSLIVAWMPLPKSYVTDINVGKITESGDKE